MDQNEAWQGAVGHAKTLKALLAACDLDNRFGVNNQGVLAILSDYRGVLVSWPSDGE
jgi:hypothetical protein